MVELSNYSLQRSAGAGRSWPSAIILAALLFMVGHSADAQLLGKDPRPYAAVGSHLSSTTMGSGGDESDARLGFCGGLGVRLPTRPTLSSLLLLSFDRRNVRQSYSGRWYQPELGRFFDGTWVHDVSISYITGALHLRWAPVHKLHVFVGGGPQIGIPVSATGERHWNSEGASSDYKEDIMGYIGSPECDVLTETGLELSWGHFVWVPTVTCTLGLTQIGGDDGKIGRVRMGLGDAKHRMVGLSLGIWSR